MENKTGNKVNFQFEYLKNIYNYNPVIAQELFRLNFPAPKESKPNKSKAKK
jgi:hypothetical protein